MDRERLSAQVDKPAPGPLVAVQVFVNTLDLDDAVDRLDSAQSLREWLVESGFAEPGVEVSDADLREARRLRDSFRAALYAHAHGETGQELPEIPCEAPIRLVPGAGGRLELALGPAATVAEHLSQLLGIAYRAQLLDQWQRLKLCENEECAWAFYDSSRNRSGSWCRMEVCGNRVKNREYRRRHAREAGAK